MRVGNGFDVHRLVPQRPLILGGLTIDFERGLQGHSDGDVLTHAIIDALLGAAGLGDIGMWFPPEDETHKGANSLNMLSKVVAALLEHEYKILNVDSVIICERPKLSPHFAEMRKLLAEAMGIGQEQVSVKASTAEKLGAIGDGQAIAVQAVALID